MRRAAIFAPALSPAGGVALAAAAALAGEGDRPRQRAIRPLGPSPRHNAAV